MIQEDCVAFSAACHNHTFRAQPVQPSRPEETRKFRKIGPVAQVDSTAPALPKKRSYVRRKSGEKESTATPATENCAVANRPATRENSSYPGDAATASENAGRHQSVRIRALKWRVVRSYDEDSATGHEPQRVNSSRNFQPGGMRCDFSTCTAGVRGRDDPNRRSAGPTRVIALVGACGGEQT